MADGLAGHEMEFYPYVMDNPWLGGTQDYSDLNEALPYWFNGLVALAYALDDPTLIGQVTTAANFVLSHQNSTTGWLGPETTYDSNSLWGRIPFVYGLMQLAEANSSMTDAIVQGLYKYIPLMDSLLEDGKSDTEAWGRTRYSDMNIVMQWLYEQHPNDNTSVLLEAMDRWRTHGVDWAGYYTQANYIFEDLDMIPLDQSNALFPNLHGVNVGQGLKTMGVNWRFTNDDSLVQVSHDAANWTFKYHGAASGTILADEREAGLNPDRGSELCTTVETMRSMTYLYQLFGDPLYGDQAELMAFNALPTQVSNRRAFS
jgi:Beta-L-arabinofuranosidase, GH127